MSSGNITRITSENNTSFFRSMPPVCSWITTRIQAIWNKICQGIGAAWDWIKNGVGNLFGMSRSVSSEAVYVRDAEFSAELKTKIVALAKERGVNSDPVNERIADSLLAQAPRFIVSSISVHKLCSHIFSGGQVESSIQIKIELFQSQFSRKNDPSLENLQKSICALLGSDTPSHLTAVKQIIKSFKAFELYISTDFQNVDARFIK